MGRKAGDFRLLSHYTYCVPGTKEIIVLLLMLLAGGFIGSLVTLAFEAAMGQAGSEYSMLVAYPVMFIPAMMYAAGVSRRKCMDHGGFLLDSNGHFKPLGGPACAGLVVVGTLSMSFVADAAGSVLPEMPEWLAETLDSMTQGGSLILNLLCVSVFAPFFEEWLCRGTVLRGLLGKGVKPVWAIVVSALFFALIHANPWQAIPAFLLGCLFGYVYLRTGSLKLTMLMHCTNNTAAVILSRIDSFSQMDTWRDVLTGPEYWVTLFFCLLLTGLVVYAFRRIPLNEQGHNCDPVPPIFEQK